MTMDFLSNFARWGSPTPVFKPSDRPAGYEPYDDFLYNLTWSPFNPGNHYLYINASLHQPYGCAYKYVFDHTIPIGGSNPVCTIGRCVGGGGGAGAEHVGDDNYEYDDK